MASGAGYVCAYRAGSPGGQNASISSHPMSIFKGLVKGEVIRFLRSNTDAHTYYNTISTFRKHLLRRNYPRRFVDSILRNITYDLRASYIPNLSPSPSPASNIPRLIITYSPYYTSLSRLINIHLIRLVFLRMATSETHAPSLGDCEDRSRSRPLRRKWSGASPRPPPWGSPLRGPVTTNLDPPFFVPPSPYISKYLDSQVQCVV